MAITTNELDFAPHFDGSQTEVSELEALDAAGQFRSGMDDVFLGNMSATLHHSHASAIPPQQAETLRLVFQGDEPTKSLYIHEIGKKPDRPKIHIWVESRTYTHGGIPEDDNKLSVLLTEFDHDGQKVRFLGYLLHPNGEKVIRHEAKDGFELYQGNWTQKLGEIMLKSNNIDEVSDAANEQANQELEGEMGNNDKAVGLKEVQSLLALLAKSKPIMPAK